MKRIIITAGAALLAAVPASIGLVGNTSFAQSVPVRVPAHAVVLDDSSAELDDTTAEAIDDKKAVAAVTAPKAVEDKARVTPHVESGDDSDDATDTDDDATDTDADSDDATDTNDDATDTDADSDDATDTDDDSDNRG